MKAFTAAGIVLAAASLASAAGETNAPRPANGSVVAVTAIDAVAIVVGADRLLRTVTIKDPQGKNVTIYIPPQVPLDQIQEGALLDVRYVEAVALTIRKAGVSPMVMLQNIIIAPGIGALAALTAKPRRVTGRIRDIERRERKLTLIGPADKPIALRVAPFIEGFDELKVGDTTMIEYTEAVALSAVKHDGDKSDSPRL